MPCFKIVSLFTLFLLQACHSSEPALETEYAALPPIDKMINGSKPDLPQLAIEGSGPVSKPILVSRGNSPGFIAYTFDQQGRLLGSYDPTVFGWASYQLAQYQQGLLAQVYSGTTYYPQGDTDYAQTITRYTYNTRQQVSYTLHYSRIQQQSTYSLSSIEQYRYNQAGEVQQSKRLLLADSSYQITNYQNGKPGYSQSYTKQGNVTEDKVYVYNAIANPLAGFRFFGLDDYQEGYPTFLTATVTPTNVYQCTYTVGYDAGGLATSITRQQSGEIPVVYNLFYKQ